MRLAIVPLIVLLASAPYVEGAKAPITSYTCTQPNYPSPIFNDNHQCNVSSGLRTCETEGGAWPNLLDSDTRGDSGLYVWNDNTDPFVILDIPHGWCVESVRMTFVDGTEIPVLSLSVHSAERLSNNTDKTVFSTVNEEGAAPVVMNLTTLACGKYLRINMTSTSLLFLSEIEVLGKRFVPSTPVSEVPSMPASTLSDATTTGEISDIPMCTALPRDPPTHNAGSTDLGHSTGVTSAVFFAGLLAGAALAGPAGALSVVCYHWKKKQAKTREKNDTTSEYKEPDYDCPLQLKENPAYEAVHK